jgi:hypothetical protein
MVGAAIVLAVAVHVASPDDASIESAPPTTTAPLRHTATTARSSHRSDTPVSVSPSVLGESVTASGGSSHPKRRRHHHATTTTARRRRHTTTTRASRSSRSHFSTLVRSSSPRPASPAVPVTTPPPTSPPATAPPTTSPPATNPPTTAPPATDPPTTAPPATDPPTTVPVMGPLARILQWLSGGANHPA